MVETIKAYVERRYLEEITKRPVGADLEEIWRETQRRFPHRCVSYSYILKITKRIDD